MQIECMRTLSVLGFSAQRMVEVNGRSYPIPCLLRHTIWRGEKIQNHFSWQQVTLDYGQTWAKVSQPPDEGAVAVTYVRAKGRLYVTTVGNAAGLYVSEDNGQSWKAMGLKGTLLAIAVSPLDPNHIVVVNDQGEVYASRDGGATWLDK